MKNSSSQRRRADSGFPMQLLCLLLAALLVVFSAVQAQRVKQSNETIRTLSARVQALEADKEQLAATEPASVLTQDGEALAYQSLYPEMKADPAPVFAEQPEKTAYLTFDDGPSANTYRILDALRDSGQKATFFIVGKNIPGHEDALRRMAEEGHTIAVHTYSHDYREIYASVEAFLEDFHQAYNAIYDACGVRPTLFRFPGGSVNSYNRAIYQQLIAEMLRRGFVYHDWSVSSEDATGKDYTPGQLAGFVMEGAAGASRPVILMHDAGGKESTAAAVPEILRRLREAGYTCAPLTGEVKPVFFGYQS